MKKSDIFLIVSIVLAIIFVNPSFANDIGSADFDRQFSAGHSQRVFSEEFHNNETYGEDEKPKKSFDNWQLSKQIRLAMTYDDNLFRVRQDPKDDLLYTFTPLVGVVRAGKSYSIETFYTLDYLHYVENSKLRRINQGHDLRAEYHQNRWKMSFSNSIKPENVVGVGERTELDVSGNQRVIVTTDDAAFNFTYTLSPKFYFDCTQGYSLLYFPKNTDSGSANGFSTQSYITHPRIIYRIQPKTSLFLSYVFQDDVFLNNGDLSSKSDTYSVGILGKLTEKTGVSIEGGFRNQVFHDPAHLPIDGYVIKAAINRKFAQKVSGTLSMTQETSAVFDSVEGQNNSTQLDFYGINLSWKASAHMVVDGSASFGVNHRDGLVTKADPDNPLIKFTREEEDAFLAWSLALKWIPRPYVDLALSYSSLYKNSSFKNDEYDNQKLTTSVNIKF